MSREDVKFFLEARKKMSAAERWKRLRDRKFVENKKKTIGKMKTFAIPGTIAQAYQMSKKAEEALKQMAKKKASKEAKALRQMVVVTPRTYHNGRIAKNGKIYDIQGTLVAKVHRKNGNMTTLMGWSIGKYDPKSYVTNGLIQGAIDKYSPYYINLRKMQAMQQGTVWGPDQDVINIPGPAGNYGSANDSSVAFSSYGSDVAGPRQNIGATAWGAMSDNAWGTFTDNVWGTSSDTVWGTNMSDVWGGIGGNPFGGKSVQIWGTGNGHNYLKGLGARVAAFFGIKVKSAASRAAFHQSVSQVRTARSGASPAVAPTRAPAAPARR